jgi:Protein of unknown function (DUF4058)
MRSPFPGMNPYLEAPSLWPEVHHWLIIELARTLNQSITPTYRAAVEKRVYEESILVGIPDVSVVRQQSQRLAKSELLAEMSAETSTATLSQPIWVQLPESQTTIERYLEIREIATGEVIAVVEVLSPKNKRTGEGRNQYLDKRMKILSSQSHLVEIDLLRGGEVLPMNHAGASDYRVLVSRVEQRPIAQLYPFDLRDSFPCFVMPLRAEDEGPMIDLNVIMQTVYQSAALDLVIDYTQPPTPILSTEDWDWVRSIGNPSS